MRAASGQGDGPQMLITATDAIAPLNPEERRELAIRRKLAGIDRQRGDTSDLVVGDVFWFGGVRFGVLHIVEARSSRGVRRRLFCVDVDRPDVPVQELAFASPYPFLQYEPTDPERVAAARAWWQRVCAAERAELAELRGRA